MRFPTLLLISSALLFPAASQGQATVPAALNDALQSAKPGDIVTHHVTGTLNAGDFLNTTAATRLANAGGSLFYSDCPETVQGYGILYEDTLPAGENRLYLYHVNGLAPQARISAVLSNKTAQPANVTITAKSNPAPTADYISSGRTGVRLYYEETNLPPSIVIPAGGRALLDPALDATLVQTNRLINATYDFTSDQPLKVSSVMVAAGADTLAEFPTMPVAAEDEHLRQGTFAANTRTNATPYTYRTGLGIKRIRVAGSTGAGFFDTMDPALVGTDAQLGGTTSLRGNFGVTYRIRVNARSDDGRALAVVYNPRGGNYGGYVRTTFPERTGTPFGTLAPNPSHFIGSNTQVAVCAFVEPTTAEQTLLIETIPAGASSLPIDFWLVPYTRPIDGSWFMVK